VQKKSACGYSGLSLDLYSVVAFIITSSHFSYKHQEKVTSTLFSVNLNSATLNHLSQAALPDELYVCCLLIE
jgi:hypothetical protein